MKMTVAIPLPAPNYLQDECHHRQCDDLEGPSVEDSLLLIAFSFATILHVHTHTHYLYPGDLELIVFTQIIVTLSYLCKVVPSGIKLSSMLLTLQDC